jgi:hypothetical protein
MINAKYPNAASDANNNHLKTEITKYSKTAPTLSAEELRDRN